MTSTETSQLRKKNEKELRDLLEKERARFRDLRFRLSGAQLKNIQEVEETRRSIAKILTILNEKNG